MWWLLLSFLSGNFQKLPWNFLKKMLSRCFRKIYLKIWFKYSFANFIFFLFFSRNKSKEACKSYSKNCIRNSQMITSNILPRLCLRISFRRCSKTSCKNTFIFFRSTPLKINLIYVQGFRLKSFRGFLQKFLWGFFK